MKKKTDKPAKRRPGRPVSVGKGITLTIYIPRDVASVAMRNSRTISEFIRLAIGEKMGRDKEKK